MRPRFWLTAILFLASVNLLHAQPREGTILFKDGFYVSGKVVEKRDVIFDPAGGTVSIPDQKGFMHIDDQVRRIHFTWSQVQEVLPKKLYSNLIHLHRYKPRFSGGDVLATWEIRKVGDWDDKWERNVAMLTLGGKGNLDITQRITDFTPRHFRVDATKYNWAMHYMTRELEPEAVKNLLYKYYADQKDLKKGEQHLQMARFLYQGGWYDLAEKQVDLVLDRYPEGKESALALREKSKTERAQTYAEETERAVKVGQHQVAQERLEEFFKSDMPKLVDAKNAIELQDLKNKYEAANKKMEQVQAILKDLPKRTAANRGMWNEAAESILEELSHDTLPRLETFVKYGELHINQVQGNRKPTNSADEVLAIGVTGWLLGDLAASPEVKTAHSLWRARKTVLDILRSEKIPERNQLATSLGLDKELTPDVLTRIIRQLPPLDPPQKPLGTEPTTLKFDGEGAAGSYIVQLPPDYHPMRPYPVVILLHGVREKADVLLSRWTEQAANNGYILVALEWAKGFKSKYEYSAREHAMVLDCLRDLRRKFQVDSDRVFLFGWEEGAEMAYDVGLSHPDQFAGVMPMCGAGQFFVPKYGTNAQYLPFYIVEGDRHGSNPKHHRSILINWIRNHYPVLYVEYKGRLSEWYGTEVVEMFRWMSNKRRANPTKELGRHNAGGGAGEEFKTMRVCDNRFYWLSTDGPAEKYQNEAKNWSNYITPATLQGNLSVGFDQGGKGGGKEWQQINVRTSGVRNVYVWLSPTAIDFSKPLLIRLNGQNGGVPRLIPLNLPMMLEDLYNNGDRQRLYFARIDLKL